LAYSTQDTAAVNAALKAGIRFRAPEYPDTSNALQTLVCPTHMSAETPAEILWKAIEAIDRKGPSTTVCVEVETGTVVPEYVTQGVQLLADSCYPAKVIVICGGATTHSPGPLLSEQLRAAVSKAHPGGYTWHPIAKIFVTPE